MIVIVAFAQDLHPPMAERLDVPTTGLTDQFRVQESPACLVCL